MKIPRKKVWIVLWDDARGQYVIANAIGMIFNTEMELAVYNEKRAELCTLTDLQYPIIVFSHTFPILNDWVFPLSRFSQTKEKAIDEHLKMLASALEHQLAKIQYAMTDIKNFMELYRTEGIPIMDVYCGNERRY